MGITLAVADAKSKKHLASDGLQQVKEYATILNLKFSEGANVKDIILHDVFTAEETVVKRFPTPEEH